NDIKNASETFWIQRRFLCIDQNKIACVLNIVTANFTPQFAGSSSVPAHVEMMGLIGAGNNPMVGMTVAVAVSIEEAAKAGKF
ncbi:MAG: GGGtGRT protein, partial [Lachnospiraceae bacterium]|nr:GGGtGRT protein [Lachnospiraceae bacterium]